jgi:hypothetical protein
MTRLTSSTHKPVQILWEAQLPPLAECLPSANWTRTFAPIRTDSYSDKW